MGKIGSQSKGLEKIERRQYLGWNLANMREKIIENRASVYCQQPEKFF